MLLYRIYTLEILFTCSPSDFEFLGDLDFCDFLDDVLVFDDSDESESLSDSSRDCLR